MNKLRFGRGIEWQSQPSESGGCGTDMRSLAFDHSLRCTVSFVIRRRGSAPLSDAQEITAWLLRSFAHGLVRRPPAAFAQFVMRRRAHLSGSGSTPRAMQQLSRRDGWANVLRESLACVASVVATCIRGRPGALANQTAGCLANRRDGLSFAAAIRHLLTAALGRASVRATAENFSLQSTTEAQSVLFREITGASTGANHA